MTFLACHLLQDQRRHTSGGIDMELEIAEMLLCLAVASALPYALTAGADWLREDR
jgi:hypothetical protein